jgi:hypothetical protein
LRLVTFFPERPDLSSPRFISCIARFTFLPAFAPYLRVDFFRAPVVFRVDVFFRVVVVFLRVDVFFRVVVFFRAPVVFFLRAATSDSGSSASDQVEHDQHQDDEQEDVDQTASDVQQEADEPQEEQNDDNRPEQTYHVFSFRRVSIGTLFPQSGPTNASLR